MHKSNYELNVLVNGKPVREYYHKDKFFIEAKNGTEYSIKLKNHSHKKIMAVVSVDGVDVLKGKSASEAESGYIVNPFSTLNITGYRLDDNSAVTFKFSDGKTSYATQVEQNFEEKKIEKVKKGIIAPSKNNGVIGVRIWEEKETKLVPDWKPTPHKQNKNSFYSDYNNSLIYSNCSGSIITGTFIGSGMLASISGCSSPISYTTGNSTFDNIGIACACASTTLDIADNSYIPNFEYTPKFELGTSWGQKVEDKIVKVKFEKAETYIDLEVYYLIRQELINLGIDIENSKKVFISGFPKAFAEKEDYCKRPLDWRAE